MITIHLNYRILFIIVTNLIVDSSSPSSSSSSPPLELHEENNFIFISRITSSKTTPTTYNGLSSHSGSLITSWALGFDKKTAVSSSAHTPDQFQIGFGEMGGRTDRSTVQVKSLESMSVDKTHWRVRLKMVVSQCLETHLDLQRSLDSSLDRMSINVSRGTSSQLFMLSQLGSRIFGSDLICVIDGRAVYVSNPSIHEVARLPDWNHSSLSTAGVGLGYLASMNEYKIVQFYYLNDQGFNYEVGVEIYTLKDGRPNLGFWRKVEIFPSMRMLWVEYSVVANGAIYWLFTEEAYGEEKIVSMDLENEDFTNIRCPEVCIDVDKGDKTSLIELKGFLCFAHFSQKDSVMNLWMLKDQETHFWLQEYTIDLRGIPGSYTGLGYVPWDDHGVDVWGCIELLLEIGEERPNEVGVEIYTFRDGRPNSGLWREVENFHSIRMLWMESSSVVANGAMH
ncbi:hypothetical protein Acr_01g0003300 [Actinidia rufa]|uniref:F-box associated beta-propeller type 3 domain-containing protein n=1 Tax=Actinidia rufa TaxID=165716 RepID=A0A7J0E220_9ERIC|nr:hypothetical protein Acr_01g0003300 [Actinidia rufa]